MLKLKGITKDYITGDSAVHALKGVSLEFRKNEFVSILGQSGCGKTTLLNIIGGLDKYTSGDLVINGVSTKKYKDSDWDTYRNHSIGFVFQSYNLIPHQTVLANVELALTLCGVSKAERRKRAIEALNRVGLGDQLNKKPNQMSGGQMQRVAIARALVNNPDILLADEPTGALDSETSVQIMEILKEISKEKLIIMVTHNPELANQYSTRIINLLDGIVISDSNPYTSDGCEECEVEVLNANLKPSKDGLAPCEIKKSKTIKKRKAKQESSTKGKKRSMSFLTALSLSLNNLLTKKGRTFLTAFAGSIGIIGIALILSVSSGVNAYIDSVENSTMSSYPLSINQSSMDTMTLLESLMSTDESKEFSKDKVYSNDIMIKVMTSISSGFTENNLEAFKNYIENDPDSKIKENATDIKYIYKANLNTYTVKTMAGIDGKPTTSYIKNLNGLEELLTQIGLSSFTNNSMSMMGGNAWTELVGDMDFVSTQYNVVAGKLPENNSTTEVVLVVDENQQVSDFILYSLGIRDVEELKTWVQQQMLGNSSYTIPSTEYDINDLIGYEFKIVPDSVMYKLDGDKIVKASSDDINAYLKSEDAITVKICGIVTPKESSAVIGSIAYTSALMNRVIEISNESAAIEAQKNNTETNLLTGLKFAGYNPDVTFIEQILLAVPEYAQYVKDMTVAQKVSAFKLMLGDSIDAYLATKTYGEFSTLEAQMFIYVMSQTELGALVSTQSPENMALVLNAMLENQTYDQALATIGYIDLNKPSTISIYPKDFDSKDLINDEIRNHYNKTRTDKKDVLTYSDTVELLMSSITTIVDAITYVLIAFVSISLVVSSIMIGIITYISVLERTKEIGVLRAVGASKKDVSRVFNAETLIVGFSAGIIGILVSLGLIMIINVILFSLTGLEALKAVLPVDAAVALVAISMGLTLISGLIPSRFASKKDPVIALRSE